MIPTESDGITCPCWPVGADNFPDALPAHRKRKRANDPDAENGLNQIPH